MKGLLQQAIADASADIPDTQVLVIGSSGCRSITCSWLQERLLKPIAGFTGYSSEMRELAAVISRVSYCGIYPMCWILDDVCVKLLRKSLLLNHYLTSKIPNWITILYRQKLIILQDIYLENPDVHWDDIIGLDTAKRLVKEAVVYPIKVPHNNACVFSQ